MSEDCDCHDCAYDTDDAYADDDDDNECMAFGGTGCLHLRCPEWGGDGLCFVEMRSGYGQCS